MGRKVILICDMCLSEIIGDPWAVQAKKAGMKEMHKGELCDECVTIVAENVPMKKVTGKIAKAKKVEQFSVKV